MLDLQEQRPGALATLGEVKTFLYLHCADLNEARRFYTDGVGLTEIFFSAKELSVGYQAGSLQLTVVQHCEVSPVDTWSAQLGWKGGTSAAPSWGFQLETEPFQRAVAELGASDTDVWRMEPEWVGYWSFPVKDPMGNTIEISTVHRAAWPPAE